ncbi:MAG: hypothetical protein B7Z50_06035, partial [Sphingomonadales bacterium 12-62-5]
VAQKSDVIITMVPDTPHVAEALFGKGGVAEGLTTGKIVVDMSSISPVETKAFAEKINALGCDYLDAPVSGGEVGAKAASLTIMVGGPEGAFETVKPLFEKMGKNITLVGGNGDGQTTKVANQIIVALTIEAVGEALLFASKAGADPAKVRQALMGGFASSRILEVHGERMVTRNFDPGFRIELHQKDLNLALSSARALQVSLPNTATCQELFNAAILGRDDLSATGSGNIRLATDEYGGVVSGTLTLSRADYRVGRTAVADVPVLQVTEKNTRVLGRRTLQYIAPTRWLFNLNIKADRRLLVTGMGINSEWQADVRLRGGATTPELFGRVQLVRGDYDFAGKRFQLTRGDIRFVGGYPPDPIIAVTAENAGNGFTAFLNVEGTAQRPQIKFSSVPALPEDEVLSRVLFGSNVTDLSAPEAIQLAGALASLRGSGGGFNPIGAVGKGLGIDRLRILPADVVTGRRTTVAAGQYVGRNVYVELATDAQGYTATSIEIGLTRTLSVLSQVATLGGTSGSVRWKKDY